MCAATGQLWRRAAGIHAANGGTRRCTDAAAAQPRGLSARPAAAGVIAAPACPAMLALWRNNPSDALLISMLIHIA